MKKHKEGQYTTSRIDSRKTKPTCFLLETKFKEKILKAGTRRLIIDLSTENKGMIPLKCWKKINATLGFYTQQKKPFKMKRELGFFLDHILPPKNFIASRPKLDEKSKEIILTKGKWSRL